MPDEVLDGWSRAFVVARQEDESGSIALNQAGPNQTGPVEASADGHPTPPTGSLPTDRSRPDGGSLGQTIDLSLHRPVHRADLRDRVGKGQPAG